MHAPSSVVNLKRLCSNHGAFLGQEYSTIPELEELLLTGEDPCHFNSSYEIVIDKIEEGLQEYPDFAGCSKEEI